MKKSVMMVAGLAIAAPALANPQVTHVDTTVTGGFNNTYNYTGGGTGFGGTLGNGSISFDSDNTNLYIQFNLGGGLNDLVALFLDTRAGGFTDAQMDDQADGGRRAVSQLANNADNAFAAGFLPDFGVVLGGFGNVLFELTAGNTPGHLNFVNFDGTTNSPRTYAISLASIGITPGQKIDFFVAYTSDSGFLSNESIPAQSINAGGNPGFDGAAGYESFNRFVTVPTPGALALAGLGGLVIARRRRA